MGPRSCYEEGKRSGESLCKAYGDQYGVDVRIGRIFNSYGPRLRAEGFYGRVVSRFLLQALKEKDPTVFGDGSQTRSFCYMTDTISGLSFYCLAGKISTEMSSMWEARKRLESSIWRRRVFNYLPLGLKSGSYLFQPGTIEGACPTLGKQGKKWDGIRRWAFETASHGPSNGLEVEARARFGT